MFYLTTHSTHFIQLYAVKHMAKDHIGYSVRLPARFFYKYHPTDRIIHTAAFVTPVVEHWLEREIAQWVRRRPIAP